MLIKLNSDIVISMQPENNQYYGSSVPSNLRICPNCGNTTTGRFCGRCGNPMPVPQIPITQSTPQQPYYDFVSIPVQTKPPRPGGIVIMSVLWAIGGLINLTAIGGITSDLELIPQFSELANILRIELVLNLIITIMAVLQFVTIAGLLSGKEWSRKLGFTVPVILLACSIADATLLLTSPYADFFDPFSLTTIIGGFVGAAIYIWYLNRPHVIAWLSG
jgi:hypothetical protein